MSVGEVVGVAVIEGLIGLLLLGWLWPNQRSAVRLLGRWGVGDPTPGELAAALTYLRRRRFWYPWLFVGLGVPADVVGVSDSGWSIRPCC